MYFCKYSMLLKYSLTVRVCPGAGALVLWLWEEIFVPKVVGSDPSTVYWMDIFSHLFVVRIVKFAWKDEKEAENGLFLKRVCPVF